MTTARLSTNLSGSCPASGETVIVPSLTLAANSSADGYGCRGGRIGRERHRPFPAHEKSVRLRRLGLQIHRIPSIGEPTVIDSVRESDAGGNVRHHHDFLRSGDQPGDRLGETRRSEGLFLIQRTVGIEYEYRHVLDRVFGFFQVFGSRAVRRNDSLGAGRLPVQRNGQGRVSPEGEFSVSFSAQETDKNAEAKRHTNTDNKPLFPMQILVSIIIIVLKRYSHVLRRLETCKKRDTSDIFQPGYPQADT